jgi:hypothetical protein
MLRARGILFAWGSPREPSVMIYYLGSIWGEKKSECLQEVQVLNLGKSMYRRICKGLILEECTVLIEGGRRPLR